MQSITTTRLFTLFFMTCALLVASVIGAPIDFQRRDVYVPRIISPNADTNWVAGSRQNVTWDTSDAPVNITNKSGRVVFAENDRMFTSEEGGLDNPLASGFDILLGIIEITVPSVAANSDYQIVLFGDSGNFSPKFTITE